MPRAIRSMGYRMRVARFYSHLDLTGVDFRQAHVDQSLVKQLHECMNCSSWTRHSTLSWRMGRERARGTWPPALVVQTIRAKGKRVRFFPTVERVNALVNIRCEQSARFVWLINKYSIGANNRPPVRETRLSLFWLGGHYSF